MTMMKKRLSHFAYNERSRSGWTLSISLQNLLSPIRSTTMKTVTYVLGTFVTLVPGPNTLLLKGDVFLRGLFPLFFKEGLGEIFDCGNRERTKP
jgi:hypothetical protein